MSSDIGAGESPVFSFYISATTKQKEFNEFLFLKKFKEMNKIS
jgi:hypothetical protein